MNKMTLTRRSLGASLLAAPFIRPARAADAVRLRCSLDTVPSHTRNVSVREFLKKLEDASAGAIRGELFESGQLYTDLTVSRALVQGQVEMAVPGSWTLTGLIPNADFFQLPALYGQPLDDIHRIIDGPPGKLLAGEIEQKLRVKVLGPWLDLGFFNWYTTRKAVHALTDLNGLKIRNAGGAGQSWRARFFGAIPNTTALPDVPLALSQGTFDGIVTTNETIASGQFWDSGIRYALEDHQFIGEYIPLVSQAFWAKLTPALQGTMTRLWAEGIGSWRTNMAAAQTRAHDTMQAHGITFAVPTPDDIDAVRTRMLEDQDTMAATSKITPDMVAAVSAAARHAA